MNYFNWKNSFPSCTTILPDYCTLQTLIASSQHDRPIESHSSRCARADLNFANLSLQKICARGSVLAFGALHKWNWKNLQNVDFDSRTAHKQTKRVRMICQWLSRVAVLFRVFRLKPDLEYQRNGWGQYTLFTFRGTRAAADGFFFSKSLSNSSHQCEKNAFLAFAHQHERLEWFRGRKRRSPMEIREELITMRASLLASASSSTPHLLSSDRGKFQPKLISSQKSSSTTRLRLSVFEFCVRPSDSSCSVRNEQAAAAQKIVLLTSFVLIQIYCRYARPATVST